jgi:hypothetical protein
VAILKGMLIDDMVNPMFIDQPLSQDDRSGTIDAKVFDKPIEGVTANETARIDFEVIATIANVDSPDIPQLTHEGFEVEIPDEIQVGLRFGGGHLLQGFVLFPNGNSIGFGHHQLGAFAMGIDEQLPRGAKGLIPFREGVAIDGTKEFTFVANATENRGFIIADRLDLARFNLGFLQNQHGRLRQESDSLTVPDR